MAIDLADTTALWTASVYPANRTTAWLELPVFPARADVRRFDGIRRGVRTRRVTGPLSSSNRPAPCRSPSPSRSCLCSAPTLPARPSAASLIPPPIRLPSVPGWWRRYRNESGERHQHRFRHSAALFLGGVSAAVNGIAAPLAYVSPTRSTSRSHTRWGPARRFWASTTTDRSPGSSFRFPLRPGYLRRCQRISQPHSGRATGRNYHSAAGGRGGGCGPDPDGLLAIVGGHLQSPVTALGDGGRRAGIPADRGPESGQVGVTQVKFTLPASVPAGVEPVVVTVGGVSSPPVNVTVQ